MSLFIRTRRVLRKQKANGYLKNRVFYLRDSRKRAKTKKYRLYRRDVGKFDRWRKAFDVVRIDNVKPLNNIIIDNQSGGGDIFTRSQSLKIGQGKIDNGGHFR